MPSSRGLPSPGIKPRSPALQANSLLSEPPQKPTLAVRFFTTEAADGSVVKNLPVMQETQFQSLGQEDSPEKEMATHSSILTWEISWIEELDGLQSMGSQKSLL